MPQNRPTILLLQLLYERGYRCPQNDRGCRDAQWKNQHFILYSLIHFLLGSPGLNTQELPPLPHAKTIASWSGGGPTENIAMAEYAPVPGEDANAEDSVRRATVMCTHNLQCTLRQIGDQGEEGHQCLQTWLFH